MRSLARWRRPLTAGLLLTALVITSGAGSLAQEAPPEAAVAIVDSDYQPGTITVPPGTRVVWTNSGELRHDAVSLTGLWRSGRLGPGESFGRVFDEEGTFHYQCTVHWSMAGGVIVDSQAPPP